MAGEGTQEPARAGGSVLSGDFPGHTRLRDPDDVTLTLTPEDLNFEIFRVGLKARGHGQ